MKLDIYRKTETANSIIGELFVDNQKECVTIEPSRDTPVHPGHPCIGAGKFDVILTPSPHLGYVTPEILNVPGRTAIRIHVANFPKDLLGCTGVGTDVGTIPDFIVGSKHAFDQLMVLLQGAHDAGEKITAEWHDPQ